MKCELAKDLIILYAEDLCSKETKVELEEHLEKCPECKKRLEEYKKELKDEIKEEIKQEKKAGAEQPKKEVASKPRVNPKKAPTGQKVLDKAIVEDIRVMEDVL